MKTKRRMTLVYGLAVIAVGVWRQMQTGTSPQAVWFGLAMGGLAFAGAALLLRQNRMPGYVLIFVSLIFVGGWFLRRLFSGHPEGYSLRVILILVVCVLELLVLLWPTPLNTPRYRGIVFDLDGTLLNTLDDLADSMNRVLENRELPTHPVSAYRQFVGNGATILIARALPEDRRGDQEVADATIQFRSEYAKRWMTKTRAYDGVPLMLDALISRGLKLAVLTNKPEDFAIDCIAQFLPNWKFAVVRGQKEGTPLKPDPAGALETAADLGLRPAEILYLGDSGTDMETAVNAGMFPVGALWGFRDEAELSAHGAAAVIGSPMDLLKMV